MLSSQRLLAILLAVGGLVGLQEKWGEDLLFGNEPLTIPLWPTTMPGPPAKVDGEERDLTKPEDRLIAGRRIIKLGHVSQPLVQVYLPAKENANGGCVVICPGGGFSILAWDLEGTEVAQWLNSLGFAAAVVKYRVPTRPHGDALNEAGTMPMHAVGPVMDAQRAVSLVRSKGSMWSLDPSRIGILGFSAGGETAGLTALLGDQRAYERIDEADDAPCGPNFALLIYPAGFWDRASGGLKSYLKVSAKSPPTFFVMTQDDGVHPENCLVLFSAMLREKVPVELHLYTRGGHGYGLRPTETPVTRWSDRAAEWLKDMGFHKAASADH